MVSRRAYLAIKNALTPSEKDLINYYELQWNLRTHVPTVEEVVMHLRKKYPKIKHTSVNYYLQRQPVIKALDQRGIPWRQHSQDELTPTQVAVAVTVMNFADERPIKEKLDEMGINPTQYYAWLQDPSFKNLIDNLADKNLANIRPTAIAEFTKKINAGNWAAIRYWMEATGEFTSEGGPSNESMIMMFVEIIQKHVKDPAVMLAIAQDIRAASASKRLEVVHEPPAISGEVVEDIDLEEAKKKLGIM